ncbi:MAG: DNA polymerase IV, partial [Chloroflexi bacterium]|nr:DNA polymerase IV [Chloroflexota bacterium]
LCPGLLVISHHHGNYGEMSEKVMQRLHDLSPLVEQISIDEAFVDISDLGETPETIARRLQKRVNDELSLPCSVGVAANKLVAKIATEVGKKTAKKDQPPNAVTVVLPGQEAAFLEPLSANILWGVGPKTAAKLAGYGIKTIGDIALRPAADLVRWFGENGRDLARRACGVDDSPIATGHEAKSISQETTFARDERDDKLLAATLRELSEEVGRRLRHGGIAGTTIRIKLRWPDFTTLTRQVTMRLIGVGVSGLCPLLRQLGLWDVDSEKSRRLQEALDIVRSKFGEKAIRRGKRK